ncbi:MAG: CoA transferase, partial [Thermodesulfobacteriota bacterium]|nr:CoA transferase [Thermodesulfobacteriota bacterium]
AVVSTTVDWGVPAYSFWDIAPLGTSRLSKRQGSRGAGVPGNIHPTKDSGWVRTVVLSPWQFRRLTDWMDNPETLVDEVWDNMMFRITNRDVVEDTVDEWTIQYTKEELREGAFERSVPMVPVQSPAEFFDDPQPNARNYFVEVDHPEIGKHYYPGAPYRMTETPWQYDRPAPLLGEHNEDIYRKELGFSKEDMVALRVAGVI